MSRFCFFKTYVKTSHPVAGGTFGLLDKNCIRVFILLGIVLGGVLYLWLVNSAAHSGFYLTDLESQISVLQEEHKKMEVMQAELQTLDYIKDMSESQAMVQSSTTDYLATPPSSDVAFADNE
ncbi:MAG: hypothetical protein A2233_00845 [Candidatus Kerfeldbacteria bacterium RIFOXYA2_FULL_38_24]|uniref:Cell division protein FtsL n=1 Tax=Candidatus Kerfeldbacteria bacterium RIFOXYB2_FULL_38_14 TaxID=1798547 RepID=A0A1G2BFZ1_9BACT|nr:MAG: hypothetical protein A2233_00845 [Candidatus Kerfeldbacteria bacterium RIFOXYA2_FULL_38_24]OGY88101.1 MAG: hypothetical protein A2319_01575 [Candidatus Kerfeldbacteria bacterium RIFOXYB2_FULL_38_14]OGY88458.1 MAG: hypothetical protein A2458_02460 [Candidatus Kerfeldbacteria bacterium RIFOXYC2_FULL_38_9]